VQGTISGKGLVTCSFDTGFGNSTPLLDLQLHRERGVRILSNLV